MTLDELKEIHSEIKNHPFRLDITNPNLAKNYSNLIYKLLHNMYDFYKTDKTSNGFQVINLVYHATNTSMLHYCFSINEGGSGDTNAIITVERNLQALHCVLDGINVDTVYKYYNKENTIYGETRDMKYVWVIDKFKPTYSQKQIDEIIKHYMKKSKSYPDLYNDTLRWYLNLNNYIIE